MSDKTYTVVFLAYTQKYAFLQHSVTSGQVTDGGYHLVGSGRSKTLSGATNYFLTLTPSNSPALSGVGTFNGDVTFTFGPLLTVFKE